jgi:WD40 repeat protein
MKFNKKITFICILTVLQCLNSINLYSKVEWTEEVNVTLGDGTRETLTVAELNFLQSKLLKEMGEIEEKETKEVRVPLPLPRVSNLADIRAYIASSGREIPGDIKGLGELCLNLDFLNVDEELLDGVARKFAQRITTAEKLSEFGKNPGDLIAGAGFWGKYCPILAVKRQLNQLASPYRNKVCLHTLEGHRLRVESAKWSPGGERIATISPKFAMIWDAKSGKCIQSFEIETAREDNAVFWLSDGKKIITCHRDNAKVWDLGSRECMHIFDKESAMDGSIKCSPVGTNGTKLMICGDDGDLQVWDVGATVVNLELFKNYYIHFDSFHDYQWSPDGSKIAILTDDSIVVLDSMSFEVLREFQVLAPGDGYIVGGLGAEWSPDGRSIVTGTDISTDEYTENGEYYIKIWEVETGECIHIFAPHAYDGGFMEGARWSPDGECLFIRRADDEQLVIWDLKKQCLICDLSFYTYSMPKWANERIIFMVDDTGVQGYDVISGKSIWNFIPASSRSSAAITLFELSPDGENILVGAETSSPEIWGNKTSLDWNQSLLIFKVFNLDKLTPTESEDRLTPTEIANLSGTYAGLSEEDRAIIDGRTGNAFSLQVELGAEETKSPEPEESPKKRVRGEL